MGYDSVLATTAGRGYAWSGLPLTERKMSSHLVMCGGVYAAIREQASDWSRPEAEEDAPRLTRERIFYDPLIHAHTHPCVRSACDALAAWLLRKSG